ncbi:siderophore iron transporter, putative [Talaromyces stipitatus ATCC 10500]|uniref:Siderophore iron transporter, putative n=1 Tax=Talaromyces stipitatus (strain ATCC 10500 / CBS 375.48 / QM 6759 / NRRL 1006) TaxID=441959 RepID=B8LZX2_TALSN|nr:siderophore iron transporter, putative [Talaromyces stipitatus ATCC 10500]EED20904.1 siderophore iron transporter, putative [Talaromyces stipitatus ATCC 10500]
MTGAKSPTAENTSVPTTAAMSSPQEALDLEQLPNGYYRSKNFIGSLIAVCLMGISLYLGYVLPVNSLAAINKDLGPDPNYTLISTMFTLISGVAVLLVGRFGDIFGRRYFLIGGQFLGLIGAIVCATAKNVPTVIGGSALCGLAAAVQLTFTFVIAELVPNRLRPAVNAGIFLTTFPFAAFGGLFAQLFIANTAKSWRWSYYLNIITCSISVILLVFCYFPPGWNSKHKGVSKMEGVKKFDYIGFVLYAGGLILVLLGLSWGGASYTWSSGHVVGVLVVGFVSLAAFVFYEILVPIEQPLLPMSLLKHRGYSATVCSALVGNMVYFSMSLLWPEAIASLYTTNTIKAGWLSISTGTGVIVGEIAAGILMKPIRHSKYQLIFITLAITAFSGALAAINQNTQAMGLAFTALGGFFVGYLELITLIMCPLYCKPEDIGLASGFLGSAKQVAGTIAAAIYVAILKNRLTTNLGVIPEVAIEAGLPASSVPTLMEDIAGSHPFSNVPGITDKISVIVADAIKTAYAHSFRTVFLASIAFGGLAVIAAVFSVPIDSKLNNTVAAKLSGTGVSDEALDVEKAQQ